MKWGREGGGEGEGKRRRGRRFLIQVIQCSKYDKRHLIDPPGWSLLLGFLHEVDEAGKVDHKLEEDRQKCVEVEDVGKRALF